MTTLIQAKTRLDAWIEGTEFLLKNGHTLNLILSIESPTSDGPAGKVARDLLNKLYEAEEQYPIHTVAETIFPAWEYQRKGLTGAFEAYLQEYDTLRQGGGQRWGTYAERLIRRKTATGETVNPLAKLIEKMKSEIGQTKRGSYTACYEIGIAEGQFDLPLYQDALDKNLRRGGPCMSHISFKLFDGKVHLTSMYRSHDYRWKVPGNLLGLARLQDCVAREVGAGIGTLVVHSTYAYADRAKGPLESIISEVKKVKMAEAKA